MVKDLAIIKRELNAFIDSNIHWFYSEVRSFPIIPEIVFVFVGCQMIAIASVFDLIKIGIFTHIVSTMLQPLKLYTQQVYYDCIQLHLVIYQ